MRPMPGRPWESSPNVEMSTRQCRYRYHERSHQSPKDGVEIGSDMPASCRCGTFAIGVCARCGEAVCGDCSALDGGKRLCIEHVRTDKLKREEELRLLAEKAAIRVKLERERAARAAAIPLALTVDEAFDLLFIAKARTGQQANSAQRVLGALTPGAFAELAIRRFTATSTTPQVISRNYGSRRGLTGALRSRAAGVDEVWRLTKHTGLTTKGEVWFNIPPGSDSSDYATNSRGTKPLKSQDIAQFIQAAIYPELWGPKGVFK